MFEALLWVGAGETPGNRAKCGAFGEKDFALAGCYLLPLNPKIIDIRFWDGSWQRSCCVFPWTDRHGKPKQSYSGSVFDEENLLCTGRMKPTACTAGRASYERWLWRRRAVGLAIRCLLGITHRAFSSLCVQKQLFIWLAGLGLPRDTHFSRPKYLLFPFTSAVFGAFAWPLEMWARCVIQLPHEQAGESTAGAAYGNQIFRFLG